MLCQQELSFNPILVWFYPTCTTKKRIPNVRLSIPFWSDFIDYVMHHHPAKFRAFNPILVWFYLHRPRVYRTCWEVLSIPFWSDFIIYESRGEQKIRRHFQSHFGLILSCLDLYTAAQQFVGLSIPFWSDFIIFFTLLQTIICAPFQSHFGLILSEQIVNFVKFK